jgi:putative protease
MLELLSPAGDLEKLEACAVFGADATYIGLSGLSLRAPQQDFARDFLKKAVEIKNKYNIKLYGACNIVMRDGDFARLEYAVREAYEYGLDAVIVSDLGALVSVKRWLPNLNVHISTQANVMNSAACEAYYNMGAKRVVLARELSLDEIAGIRAKTNPALELEAFCHGAVCVSYSGRCLLSSYMTGREGNRGGCAQPCRWKYTLTEEQRPNLPFTIEGDLNGTYIMNAKDLCLLPHLDKMRGAGITSFKIEGRMKTAYYAAAVTNAYRRAVDILRLGGEYRPPAELLEELDKVSHREYSTGFYFGNPYENGQNVHSSDYIRDYKHVGVAGKCAGGRLYFSQRNKFFAGDELDVLTPNNGSIIIKADDLRDADGNLIESAPHPEQPISVKCDVEIPKWSMIRKKTIHNA